MKQVTLTELAKQLRVSPSTVSRALKGHPRISKETRDRVTALAQALNFHPNPLAINLRNQQSKNIGVIVPSISYPFYAMAISGIESVMINEGYNIIICQSEESFTREASNTRSLALNRVDGMIISLAGETQSDDHFTHVLQSGIPIVFFNRECASLDTSKVAIENTAAARAAVECLLQRGYRHIAILAGPESVHISNERLKGYRDALRGHGLDAPTTYVIHCHYTEQSGYDSCLRLLALKPRPDAIFAVSDRLAIAAMQAIKSAGLSIPGEIALMGFNNDPVTRVVDPPLATVDQNPFEMGAIAARLLLKRLSFPESQPERVILPTRVIERASI